MKDIFTYNFYLAVGIISISRLLIARISYLVVLAPYFLSMFLGPTVLLSADYRSLPAVFQDQCSMCLGSLLDADSV